MNRLLYWGSGPLTLLFMALFDITWRPVLFNHIAIGSIIWIVTFIVRIREEPDFGEVHQD